MSLNPSQIIKSGVFDNIIEQITKDKVVQDAAENNSFGSFAEFLVHRWLIGDRVLQNDLYEKYMQAESGFNSGSNAEYINHLIHYIGDDMYDSTFNSTKTDAHRKEFAIYLQHIANEVAKKLHLRYRPFKVVYTAGSSYSVAS